MEFQRFTNKNIIWALVLLAIFLVWNSVIGGIRTDHITLILISFFGYFTNQKSRKLFIAFSLFLVYWMVYDSMRVLPNYEVSPVHIQDLYETEKSLFGIQMGNEIITPNEYFRIYHHAFFDFLSGFFYINWVPVPLMMALYFYFNDKYMFAKFSLAFMVTNFAGFIIYYIYPAAPPWYVDLHGFELQLGVPGNSAGLSRFDELLNIPVFDNIFNKNANVLAAMPSVHSINPIVVLFYGMQKKLGKINWFFFVLMIGIWGAAVYTSHHYVLDVLAGIFVGVVVLLLFEKAIVLPKIDRLVQRFLSRI